MTSSTDSRTNWNADRKNKGNFFPPSAPIAPTSGGRKLFAAVATEENKSNDVKANGEAK